MPRAWTRTLVVAGALLSASCAEKRVIATDAPVYDADVAPILELHCVQCHGAVSPSGGWSATPYLSAVACVAPSGAPATLPADPRAPILSALDVAPHLNLLDANERSVLTAWVAARSPAFEANVHSAGIVDPRSSAWHGSLLRSQRWAPMLDPNDPNACGRCHEGTLSRPPDVTLAAPGATACTTCHTEPGGVLACSTCHGQGAKSYPPRDPCFFPADAAKAGAHAAHVEPSALGGRGLACATCHPLPSAEVISGLHGDGNVEVAFDPAVVAPGASYDATTQTCTVSCHTLGGARSQPAWSDPKPMGCNDCHASPPANHFPGACTTCHSEANATGTALTGGPLHMNGKVDLGNGDGTCGACHGAGGDPWPLSGAHGKHETPAIAAATECSSCHVVPAAVLAPGHLDGVVEIAFSGHALDRSAEPSWNGSSCSEVACHGAKLVDVPSVVPVWQDTTGAPSACGACHPLPPTQHTPSTSCEKASCHGGEIGHSASNVLSITSSGRFLHINGVIDVAQ